MSLTSIIAIYFIVWWLMFFLLLPWGNRTHAEAGEEIVPGSMSEAPARPRLLLKGVIAAVLAVFVLLGVNAVVVSDLSFDDLPFPNPLDHKVDTR
ncbi:putative secreted protein [Amorphus suaedae]